MPSFDAAALQRELVEVVGGRLLLVQHRAALLDPQIGEPYASEYEMRVRETLRHAYEAGLDAKVAALVAEERARVCGGGWGNYGTLCLEHNSPRVARCEKAEKR